MSELEIKVNGQPQKVSEGATVADLLAELEIAPKNLAIELNGDFFKLDEAVKTELSNGDRVEIVRFVGGG